jgi:hypothetical protein
VQLVTGLAGELLVEQDAATRASLWWVTLSGVRLSAVPDRTGGFAVAAAEQEDEALQVLAQLADAAGGVADELPAMRRAVRARSRARVLQESGSRTRRGDSDSRLRLCRSTTLTRAADGWTHNPSVWVRAPPAPPSRCVASAEA